MTTIREALPSDYKIITSFQKKMALETENLKLDTLTVQSGVRAVLSDSSKGTYYVAEIEEIITGCLMTTHEWSDWRNGWVLWIQSVYVLPEYRNKGIFASLYLHIKQLVQSRPDLMGIRLYVDKTNEKAIQVYRCSGMDGEHYQLFEWMG
ncbi:MAG: GNAT family N-acetyltransferase [Bacteroidota bacterium]